MDLSPFLLRFFSYSRYRSNDTMIPLKISTVLTMNLNKSLTAMIFP